MKIGSLFDGSGGFPLAATMYGIEPVWASEVEPYPIAVTKSRFPNMKHLGSVTDINGGEIDPVDIITFGSPCQDLSVAGKRAGLKHTENGDEETTRSGLFMEAIRIIKEMREATNGEYPRYAIWENVPGAFSSNRGLDFRVVLEELIRIAEPTAVMPPVPKAGWAYSDVYCGNGWSLAYRVLDAQYWGVPQRRRRIYLVADFRGQRAGKILFEREGLRGNFTESGAKRKATAGAAENGIGAADCVGKYNAYGVTAKGNGDAFVSEERHTSLSTGGGQPGQGYPCAMQSIPYTLKIRSGCEGGGKGALVQEGMSATLATNNDQYLFQPIPIHDQATRFSGKRGEKSDGKGNGLGIGAPGDPMNTLTNGDRHAVAYWDGGQTCGTLTANNAGGSQRMPDKDNFNCVIEEQPLIVFDKEVYNSGENATGGHYITEGGPAPTLRGTGHAPGVCVRYIVRRLTPTECARLQGFPDEWGHPDQKSELTDEEYHFWLDVRNTHAAINGKTVKDYTKQQMLTWYNKLHTDSSEYKMWGNGIALPCVLYVMQGIAEA